MTGSKTSRIAAWLCAALVLALLPVLFPQDYALTLMTRIAVMVIFVLSYHLLYGEAGMLSFGHALYFGAGAFCAVHVLNAWEDGGQRGPAGVLVVTLLPLAGGAAGVLAAAVTGAVNARRGGLVFAMISLALVELVLAAAPMLPSVFGGVGGVTTDRVAGTGWFGISYGPQVQVYGLAAAWLFASALAMRRFTRTALGRMANAVRDNAERAAFIGCDPRAVRWRVMMAAGFFAGVAGALSAIQYEVATIEALGRQQSAAALVAAVIGGSGSFAGPVAGAVAYELSAGALASFTPAWPFYLGCLFIAVMLFAPGGLCGLLPGFAQDMWGRDGPNDSRPDGNERHGRSGRTRLMLLGTLAGVLLTIAGLVGLVELAYLATGRGETSALADLIGLTGHSGDVASWMASAILFALGIALCAWQARRSRTEMQAASTPNGAGADA